MPSTRPDADRSVLVCGLALLVATVSACSARDGEESAPPRSVETTGRSLGAVFQTLDNPFFREVDAGIREVVEARGDSLETLAADWNGARQDADIRRLLAKGVGAVFVNPVESDLIRGSLRLAAERNVPCVVVDTQLPTGDAVACQVLSDNREAGRLAARSLCQARATRRVVVLHIPANEACIDRIAGFREVVGRSPGLEILAVEDGGGTTPTAEAVMTALLERFPDMDGVFAANDPMALGAIAALERAGRTAAVEIVSVDGSAGGIAAVQAGRLRSTSMQFPREIGRIAAQRAYELLGGNAVETEIRVPVELVTRENAHAFASVPP